MKSSSFEQAIQAQFDCLTKKVIKRAAMKYKRSISRRLQHEVLFCELPEMKQIENSMNDNYSHEFVSFQVLNFVIRISDEKLSTALKELTEKQRTAILLHFFQGMNDREISELYHVSRSAINSRRDRGLKKLQKLLNERK